MHLFCFFKRSAGTTSLQESYGKLSISDAPFELVRSSGRVTVDSFRNEPGFGQHEQTNKSKLLSQKTTTNDDNEARVHWLAEEIVAALLDNSFQMKRLNINSGYESKYT